MDSAPLAMAQAFTASQSTLKKNEQLSYKLENVLTILQGKQASAKRRVGEEVQRRCDAIRSWQRLFEQHVDEQFVLRSSAVRERLSAVRRVNVELQDARQQAAALRQCSTPAPDECQRVAVRLQRAARDECHAIRPDDYLDFNYRAMPADREARCSLALGYLQCAAVMPTDLQLAMAEPVDEQRKVVLQVSSLRDYHVATIDHMFYRVTDPNNVEVTEVVWLDCHDGRYVMSFLAAETGEYSVNVYLYDVHVNDSPLPVVVSSGLTAAIAGAPANGNRLPDQGVTPAGGDAAFVASMRRQLMHELVETPVGPPVMTMSSVKLAGKTAIIDQSMLQRDANDNLVMKGPMSDHMDKIAHAGGDTSAQQTSDSGTAPDKPPMGRGVSCRNLRNALVVTPRPLKTSSALPKTEKVVPQAPAVDKVECKLPALSQPSIERDRTSSISSGLSNNSRPSSAVARLNAPSRALYTPPAMRQSSKDSTTSADLPHKSGDQGWQPPPAASRSQSADLPVKEERSMDSETRDDGRQSRRGGTDSRAAVFAAPVNLTAAIFASLDVLVKPETRPLERPIGVTAAKQHVYVADTGNNEVRCFSVQGQEREPVGAGLRRPSALVLLSGDRLAVRYDYGVSLVDLVTGRVTPIGERLLRGPFGLATAGPDRIVTIETRSTPPVALVFDVKDSADVQLVHSLPLHNCVQQAGTTKLRFVAATNMRLAVVDLGSNLVYLLDWTGALSVRVGEHDRPERRLHDPAGVAFDSAGNLLVADSKNHRLVVYNSHGEWMHVLDTGCQLKRPSGISLRDDKLYVLNYWDNSVHLYSLLAT